MVWVNSENVRHLPTPFGGMKSSGIGRDGGDYSFDFYMETKNIAIALGHHKIPKLGVQRSGGRARSELNVHDGHEAARREDRDGFAEPHFPSVTFARAGHGSERSDFEPALTCVA